MEGSPIVRDKERLGKTIEKTIKNYLDLIGLSINMVYDETL